MEETDLEVKGLHDELVEERARESRLAQRIALLTAILSSIGAVFSFQSNNTGVEAEVLKSSAIAKMTQASGQWAYYQAKATREYLSSSAAIQTDDLRKKATFLADAKRYDAEKEEVRSEALKLEAEARQLDAEAAATLRPHHRMALAMVFVQIAIAMASITALTRKRWLLVGAVGSALLGLATAVSGLMR
ncbi:DUF4337 domain-containing protein [Noviherbaspirillum pedocola]|uniref:DUF4337 domain-containing protein n=1 Tax=Noviherbaspirillum pedocola TaxID=2801341 RepID=A0A934SUC3_9BURK|nr:DUF4337 domain-containing protein [Noviherbaspirillum pedocola]MBK4735862.1 DUF4337 domain-containing protein [Noviherbaspirillum pedocola]